MQSFGGASQGGAGPR
jgi:Transcription initiation factor IIA, gamma subunit/Transcription initiation factor IIA, gamma subunit, helical domain